mmetsp:Transcript_32370/g.89450  ORF Transcript_32370/g.89450 Transcript_32370/m.89450 type:complete len:224 (-) Transcript_32370:342-1013(-)
MMQPTPPRMTCNWPFQMMALYPSAQSPADPCYRCPRRALARRRQRPQSQQVGRSRNRLFLRRRLCVRVHRPHASRLSQHAPVQSRPKECARQPCIDGAHQKPSGDWQASVRRTMRRPSFGPSCPTPAARARPRQLPNQRSGIAGRKWAPGSRPFPSTGSPSSSNRPIVATSRAARANSRGRCSTYPRRTPSSPILCRSGTRNMRAAPQRPWCHTPSPVSSPAN